MTNKFITFILIGLAGLVGCQDKASETSKIEGTVSYRERIALPATAQVIVSLEDVSKVGAKADIVSEIIIPLEGKQVPVTFELPFAKDKIQEKNRYVVRAKIKVADDLKFTTDTAYPVLTDTNKTQNVSLVLKMTR